MSVPLNIPTYPCGCGAMGTHGVDHDDYPQEAPAAPRTPVTALVDWTSREGTTLRGIMTFAGIGAGDTADGREPQFLITGGTRRKTMDASNDYDSNDQFRDSGPLEDVAARAAAWLGLTGRPLDIKVDHEWRI